MEQSSTLLADAARPLSVRGVVLSGVTAAPVLLGLVAPSPAWLLVAGAGVSVVHVLATSHVARGRPGFLDADPAAPRASTTSVTGRGFAVFVLAAFPIALAVAGSGDAPTRATDLLGAMLATTLYVPSAVGAVVVSGHPATAFWPFAWMRLIGTIGPTTYARLATLYALGVAAAWSLLVAGATLATRTTPLGSTLASYAATLAANLVLLAQGCALGHVLRERKDALRL